ncbi:hypothetical protein [Micromonospora tulbaghiae]|nr:hypothetical protein [Micromonospora tulbaghiae]
MHCPPSPPGPVPAYCKDAVVFNTKQCWGFVTTTDRFADPSPYRR